MRRAWNQPYTLKSFKSALHSGAIDRYRDTALVVWKDVVIEGQPTLGRAERAAQILNTHDAGRLDVLSGLVAARTYRAIVFDRTVIERIYEYEEQEQRTVDNDLGRDYAEKSE